MRAPLDYKTCQASSGHQTPLANSVDFFPNGHCTKHIQALAHINNKYKAFTVNPRHSGHAGGRRLVFIIARVR